MDVSFESSPGPQSSALAGTQDKTVAALVIRSGPFADFARVKDRDLYPVQASG